MLSFQGIKSSCQINLPSTKGNGTDSSNKWNKTWKESNLDPHKVYASKRFIYATCNKTLVIHDSEKKRKSFLPQDFESDDYHSKQETKLSYATSLITCLGFDEPSGVVCTCSDDAIHLVRWDSILGKWETIVISEGEGRILSCSVTVRDNMIFVTLFKNDSIIVYEVKAIHPLEEPGPLLLESIDCTATLEKVKEPTAFSKSYLQGNSLRIVSVSSGNTTSVMLWELSFAIKGLKLINHQTVRHTKSEAVCDIQQYDDEWFIIVMNPEGYGEIFVIQPTSFVLINRIKVEESNDSPPPENINSSFNANTISPAEFRILGVKFFFQKEKLIIEKDTTDDLSCGDARCFPIPELDNSLAETNPTGRKLCPSLVVAVATSRQIIFIDAKTGEVELSVKYEELLKEQDILVHSAKFVVDQNDIVIALQPCLTRVVFCRRFTVLQLAFINSNDFEMVCSLVPREVLCGKSVLRKRIKSPPKEETIKGSKSLGRTKSRYLPDTKPAWARSRSRTTVQKKFSNSLMSARGVQSSSEVPSGDGLLTSRPLRIQVKGSYQDSNLGFSEILKVSLDTRLSEGLSYIRLAGNRDGKLLAVGGSASPLIVMKTQPFETIRRLKDVSKITSLSFSFNSDLLLLACNEGKTTMIHWQNTKELLSFDFNSKFNEHIHTQFYFMDKFILQPEENKIVLYSYAKRDTGFIKLQAGSFIMNCQSITAIAAANQFYSNQIICGLSNKSIQVFDTNAEKVSMIIGQTHGKAVSCIRLNEAPKGSRPTELCDVFMSSSISTFDPIKLWDLRSAKCILRISDTNPSLFVPSTRPAISPCGRYIASSYEDNSLILYDIRKINSRVMTFKGLKSTVLDCCFDTNLPMIWCGCRNGTFWNYYTQ